MIVILNLSVFHDKIQMTKLDTTSIRFILVDFCTLCCDQCTVFVNLVQEIQAR